MFLIPILLIFRAYKQNDKLIKTLCGEEGGQKKSLKFMDYINAFIGIVEPTQYKKKKLYQCYFCAETINLTKRRNGQKLFVFLKLFYFL